MWTPLIEAKVKTRQKGHQAMQFYLKEEFAGDAEPIFVFDQWLDRLPERQSLDGMLTGLSELKTAISPWKCRTIVVESVPDPGGVEYVDFKTMERVKVSPEELGKLRGPFLEELRAVEGVEIAPVSTVYKHVRENVPAWDTTIGQQDPEFSALWSMVVFCTMTRQEPPLQKFQESLAKFEYWEDIDEQPGKSFLDLPPETLAELAEFVLAAVENANKR